MGYVLFGAGQCGCESLKYIDKEKVDFFIDNSTDMEGDYLKGIPVYPYKMININDLMSRSIILTVSKENLSPIIEQLKKDGINEYTWFMDILSNDTLNKLKEDRNIDEVYKKAKEWIVNNTLIEDASTDRKSIINSGYFRKGYPEVTGYYIPSLIRAGMEELALAYLNWLIYIQKDDGSFYDTENRSPYVFDTGQVLRGFVAAYKKWPDYPGLYDAIERASNYIISNISQDGRLRTPDTRLWINGDESIEFIHLYCLKPLVDAGIILNDPVFAEKAGIVLDYYKTEKKEMIEEFSTLSHFYAYVMEALLEMGEIEICKRCMNKIRFVQDTTGTVSAYKDQKWVCSTGLIQLAMIWYRLGDEEYADKALNYVSRLQNSSGGWYGSYVTKESLENAEYNNYFPFQEISWANKFYLDAVYYKNCH